MRGIIVIMSPLPDLDKAYQMLIQEEHQRSVDRDTNSTVGESTSLMVQKRGTNYKTNEMNNERTSDFWGKYCISCKKKGYVVDTCCFIYGFPKGYPLHGRKFNNKKKKEFSQKTNTDKGKIYLRIRVRVRSTFLHQKAKEGYRIEMRRKTRTW